MPNRIDRVVKHRKQLLTLGLLALVLVFGLPFTNVTEQAKASNPGIAASVEASAAAVTLDASNTDNGKLALARGADAVVLKGGRFLFHAVGLPEGGAYQWTRTGAQNWPLGADPIIAKEWEFLTKGYSVLNVEKEEAKLKSGLEEDYPNKLRGKTPEELGEIVNGQGLQGYVDAKILEINVIQDPVERNQRKQSLVFDFHIYAQGIRPVGNTETFGPLPEGKTSAWYYLYGVIQKLITTGILTVDDQPVAITATGNYPVHSLEASLWSLFTEKGASSVCGGKAYPQVLKPFSSPFIKVVNDPGPETPTSIQVKSELSVTIEGGVYKIVIIKGTGAMETWVGCLALKQANNNGWVITEDLKYSATFSQIYRMSRPMFGKRVSDIENKDPVADYKANIPEFVTKYGDFFGRRP